MTLRKYRPLDKNICLFVGDKEKEKKQGIDTIIVLRNCPSESGYLYSDDIFTWFCSSRTGSTCDLAGSYPWV